MTFNKTLAASIVFIFVSPAFAGGGEDPAHQNAGKGGQYSLPAVERIDEAYPTAITTQERLMEAVPSLDAGEVGEFFILKGEKLHTAMERWTKTAGYELVWQPNPEDGDIRFAANMVFKDTFKNAAKEFFVLVRKQTKFDAQLHSNGVLRVFVAKAN